MTIYAMMQNMDTKKFYSALKKLLPIAHPHNDYYNCVQLNIRNRTAALAATDNARITTYQIGTWDVDDVRLDIQRADAKRLLESPDQPIIVIGDTLRVGETDFHCPPIGAHNLVEVAPSCMHRPSVAHPITIHSIPQTHKPKHDGRHWLPTEAMQFRIQGGDLMLGQHNFGPFPLPCSLYINPYYISDIYRLLPDKKSSVMFSFDQDTMQFGQGDLTYWVSGIIRPECVPLREI